LNFNVNLHVYHCLRIWSFRRYLHRRSMTPFACISNTCFTIGHLSVVVVCNMYLANSGTIVFLNNSHTGLFMSGSVVRPTGLSCEHGVCVVLHHHFNRSILPTLCCKQDPPLFLCKSLQLQTHVSKRNGSSCVSGIVPEHRLNP
jgi:hypothetical protein